MIIMICSVMHLSRCLSPGEAGGQSGSDFHSLIPTNMKSFPAPSFLLNLNMEGELLRRKIASFVPWLLLVSTPFILFTVSFLKPLVFTSQEVVISPPFSEVTNNGTTTTMSVLKQYNDVQNKKTISNVTLELKALPPAPSPSNPENPSSAGGTKEQCDLYSGKWVWDPREPLYTNSTCPTLPDSRNCIKYGKDDDYLHWRWKPDGCELDRLEPETFLGIVRDKKMAFVGDSLARNHMEALLCALSQVETPINIYKDTEDKSKTWHFPSHNFTLMVMWTEFLVARDPHVVNGTAIGFNVHLDKIDTDWTQKLPELNYLIINNGNWFFRRNHLYENNNLIGCVSCWGETNLTDLGVALSVKSVVKTTLQYLNRCEECRDDLVVVLRTFSPSHFEHGYWFNGGYCNRSWPWNGGDVGLSGMHSEVREKQLEEMMLVRGGERVRFRVIDVSEAMAMRVDGHPNSHWTWGVRGNDCLHWCLPGAIDVWNDMLLAVLKES